MAKIRTLQDTVSPIVVKEQTGESRTLAGQRVRPLQIPKTKELESAAAARFGRVVADIGTRMQLADNANQLSNAKIHYLTEEAKLLDTIRDDPHLSQNPTEIKEYYEERISKIREDALKGRNGAVTKEASAFFDAQNIEAEAKARSHMRTHQINNFSADLVKNGDKIMDQIMKLDSQHFHEDMSRLEKLQGAYLEMIDNGIMTGLIPDKAKGEQMKIDFQNRAFLGIMLKAIDKNPAEVYQFLTQDKEPEQLSMLKPEAKARLLNAAKATNKAEMRRREKNNIWQKFVDKGWSNAKIAHELTRSGAMEKYGIPDVDMMHSLRNIAVGNANYDDAQQAKAKRQMQDNAAKAVVDMMEGVRAGDVNLIDANSKLDSVRDILPPGQYYQMRKELNSAKPRRPQVVEALTKEVNEGHWTFNQQGLMKQVEGLHPADQQEVMNALNLKRRSTGATNQIEAIAQYMNGHPAYRKDKALQQEHLKMMREIAERQDIDIHDPKLFEIFQKQASRTEPRWFLKKWLEHGGKEWGYDQLPLTRGVNKARSSHTIVPAFSAIAEDGLDAWTDKDFIKYGPEMYDRVMYRLRTSGDWLSLKNNPTELDRAQRREIENIVNERTGGMGLELRSDPIVTARTKQFDGSELVFHDDGHVYVHVDEDGNTIGRPRSVTTVIENSIPQFDSWKISEQVAKKQGIPQTAVLKKWDREGKLARDMGTNAHMEAQRVFNNEPDLEIPEPKGNAFEQNRERLIRENIRRKAEEVKASGDYQYVEAEVLIADKEANIAGAIDSLLIDHDGNIVISDWKTSKEISMAANGKPWITKCYGVLQNHDNVNGTHYSMQQSMYAEILRRQGGFVALDGTRYEIGPDTKIKTQVWHATPDGVETIELKDLTNEAKIMLGAD
jgi:RecB family exonuclease